MVIGVQRCALPIGPARDEAPVRRGLAAIAEKFRAQDAEGPTWVARFFSPAGEDEFERLRLDALMTIQEVWRLTGWPRAAPVVGAEPCRRLLHGKGPAGERWARPRAHPTASVRRWNFS